VLVDVDGVIGALAGGSDQIRTLDRRLYVNQLADDVLQTE